MRERLAGRENRPGAALEVVEGSDGRDGHGQTDRGGHQRLGDRTHDVAARRATEPGALQLVERLDDADHRAEQTHEGRVVAQRAEERQATFELQATDGRRARHRLARGVCATLSADQPRANDGTLDRTRAIRQRAGAREVTLRHDVKLQGNVIPAGVYTLHWEDDGAPGVEVIVRSGRNVVARATGSKVVLDKAATHDASSSSSTTTAHAS